MISLGMDRAHLEPTHSYEWVKVLQIWIKKYKLNLLTTNDKSIYISHGICEK